MLAAAGRSLDTLPADMQSAYSSGTLTKTSLSRYLSLDSDWLTKLFMPLQGAALLCIGEARRQRQVWTASSCSLVLLMPRKLSRRSEAGIQKHDACAVAPRAGNAHDAQACS